MRSNADPAHSGHGGLDRHDLVQVIRMDSGDRSNRTVLAGGPCASPPPDSAAGEVSDEPIRDTLDREGYDVTAIVRR